MRHTAATVRVYVPLAKAREEVDRGERRRLIYGVASTEDWDLQEQRVLQDGVDFDPLLEFGWLNWNHMENPGALLGEPIAVEIGPYKGRPALHASGVLYRGVQWADELWDLMKALPLNEARRKIGWSIQGHIESLVEDEIRKCTLTHLALTHEPVNPFTFALLARSLRRSMTGQSAAPMRLQNLDSGATEVLWGPCRADHYDGRGRFRQGIGGAFRHLVACRGMGADEARRYLRDRAHLFHGRTRKEAS